MVSYTRAVMLSPRRWMRHAFTLIEILIVITMLAIIMAAVVSKVQQSQSRARDVARKADLKQLGDALAIYMNDVGSYPTGSRLSSDFAQNGTLPLVPNILRVLPKDIETAPYELGIFTTGGQYISSTSGAYGYVSIPGSAGSRKYGMVLVSKVENYQVGNWILTNDWLWSLSPVTFNTGAGPVITYVTGAAAVAGGGVSAVNILSTSNLSQGLCNQMALTGGTSPYITGNLAGAAAADFVPSNNGRCFLPNSYKTKVKYIYIQG